MTKAEASQVVGKIQPAPLVTQLNENDMQAELVVLVAGASVHTFALHAAAAT